MKIFYTLCTFLLLVSFSAYPQVLLEENFDQAAGTALTTFGWSAHSGGVTNPVSVVSPGLSYENYPLSGIGNAASLITSGQDVNHYLSDTLNTSGSLYTALLVSVTSAQTPGDYFFNLMEGPTNTFGLVGRLYVRLAANGNLTFGIGKSSTNASVPPVYTDSVYTTGTPYLLVVKYTINPDTLDDVASLFINPVLGSVEPAALVTSTTTSATTREPARFGAIALRQGSGTNAANVTVDGIRVAKSWSDLNLMTLAQVREDLDADLVPDRKGDTVHVQGVVFTPNYQTANKSYYIWDGTAGIATFKTGLATPTLNLGDKIDVVGFIDHFNGLTEITPLTDTSLVVLSDSNETPEYQAISLAEFYTAPESYEGEFLAFKNLTKKSGTWPATGSANLVFTDGVDTLVVRIDSDTDVDGNVEPTYPIDVLGVITQFDNTAPYSAGYQLQPRYYAEDFLPGGTVPVELTAFTASVSGAAVRLSWTTASEANNRGFEIQRKNGNGNFESLSFVAGNGTTTQQHSYSFTDKNVPNGIYVYRLKQLDYSGAYKYSTEVQADITAPVKYTLEQNFPNPFNPSTKIRFSVPADSKVTLTLFNILGQEISTLINNNYVAGAHEFTFNATNLNSGIYFYKIVVSGIDGSSYTSVKKMTLTK